MESLHQTPAPRTPLQLNIDFRRNYGRKSIGASLRNISLTGAFIEHAAIDLMPLDKVYIDFRVSGRSRRLSAEVVWVSNGGSGIRFQPESQRDVQIVDDLIYFLESRREKRRNFLDHIFKRLE